MSDLRIELVEGFLSKVKADVVVNSTTLSLKLDMGSLSKFILTAAGKQIQEECSKRYPNGIELGKIAVTAGYKMQCKKVYHGALVAWDAAIEGVEPQQILVDLISECLEQAHKDKVKSIALPTLGCGFLNFPHNVVASTIAECIAIYKSLHEDSPIQVIYIVIYTRGQDWRHIKQAFQQEFPPQAAAAAKAKPDRKVPDRLRRPMLNRPRNNIRIPPQAPAVIPTAPAINLLDTCQREQAHNSCKKVLVCGHICGGVKNERACPPCLQHGCPGHGGLTQEANDNCTICFTDILSAAPVIKLACGHLFHLHCAKRILDNKWVGARITFNFMKCPICKENIEHELLDRHLAPLKALRDSVERKANMRLQFEGKDRSRDIRDRNSPYYNKPVLFAMEKYCYYPCFKCKEAYFGGEVQCEQAAGDVEFDAKDLICPRCANPDPKQVCDKHGTSFLEYKCHYCCTVAVYFCHGTTHFCQECHDNYGWWTRFERRNILPKCPAGPCGKQLVGSCPLNTKHPPTGSEYSLGCGLCKNTQSF